MKLTVSTVLSSLLLASSPLLSLATPLSTASEAVNALEKRQVQCDGRTKFQYFGVNESGAEWGGDKLPGTAGTDYVWPTNESIDFHTSKGFNTFRIAFLMERMVPGGSITGPLAQGYLGELTNVVNYITGKGAFAIIDPHNYLRYNNNLFTNPGDFQTFWQNLAGVFAGNPNVIFDLQNEPYGVDAQTVAGMMQAGINGVRAAGATTQLILVEGTQWTGAHSWTTGSGNSDAFTSLTDPNNNFAIEMHQYFDSDFSGKVDTCNSPTVGTETLTAATQWLKDHGLRGFLGEIGAGNNDVCIQAVQGAMCTMQQSGVWIGTTWWAAGPWWGDYFTSIEPPNGAAIARILPEALLPFM